MPYENAYIAAVLVSGAIALVVARWLWSDDLGREARVFVAFMLLHPLIALPLATGLVVPVDSAAARWLFGITNGLAVLVIPLWVVFAVLYTDREHWLSRPVVGVFVAPFALEALLEVTNPLHGLVWSGYAVAATPFPYVVGEPTPLFVVRATMLTLGNLFAMGLLAQRFLFGSGVTRAQTVALLVGFTPPWIVISAFAAGVLPGPLNGWFTIGSVWSFALVAWAVYRYQLFDVVPLARETVFEELDDPVVVVDSGGRLLDTNRAAVEAFPELVGAEGTPIRSVLPAVAGDEPEAFAEQFTYVGESEPREYAVSVSRLEAGEQVRGYALILRDVTEREAHVRDLERQTDQLERFASTLSHDLRNPLNVAHARVKGAIGGGGTEKLGEADRALDRIAEMIDDLLTLAREGQTIDETERVDLSRVLRAAWETTETKDATLEVEADLVVFADVTRLQNVFENLLRNAIQHGGEDVTVTLGRHEDGFFLEDDGRGVPPDDRERVFDFDFTTHEAGTGLGLAIVEAIAQAHGWTVSMEAGREGGARVVFSDVDVVEEAGDVESATAAA